MVTKYIVSPTAMDSLKKVRLYSSRDVSRGLVCLTTTYSVNVG